MKKSISIGGVAGCALLGAGIGCLISMAGAKKPPLKKTVGCAMKNMGNLIEHFSL